MIVNSQLLLDMFMCYVHLYIRFTLRCTCLYIPGWIYPIPNWKCAVQRVRAEESVL